MAIYRPDCPAPMSDYADIMRKTPGWLRNWLERHQDPRSFWLHMVGIPMTIWAVTLAGVQLSYGRWDVWWRPAGLFLLGYALQWFGHRLEGNTMGELILIRKLRGRPYTAVSPRFQKKSQPDIQPNSNPMR